MAAQIRAKYQTNRKILRETIMSANETAEAILIVLRRIFKWIFLVVLAVALFFAALIGYEKAKQYYEQMPKLIDQLMDVKIGMKFEDLMFRHPGFVLEKDSKSKPNIEAYANEKSSLYVNLIDKKVARVMYACKGEFDINEVSGVFCGSKGDLIFERYRKSVRVQCLKDKNDKQYLTYRVYDIPEYGMRYHVVANEVVVFDVSDPKSLNEENSFVNAAWATCQ